jgi:hypothetical protein
MDMRTPEHASRYEIRVKGALNARWSAWFAGFEVGNCTPSETTLTGLLRDQAELHGVLARVRDLGLPLVEVRCLDRDAADAGPRRAACDSTEGLELTVACDQSTF